VKNHKNLKPGVIRVPDEIDAHVANKKLASCGLSIDVLSAEQKKYISGWNF
jgi:adenosylhomocysteinase